MEQTAKVNLNGDFTAAELEEIISDMAHARASLEPAVPDNPPVDLDQAVLEQSEPLFTAVTLASGGLRIWLRNDGFGWLAFTLTRQTRIKLGDFLGQKIGHTHTFQ